MKISRINESDKDSLFTLFAEWDKTRDMDRAAFDKSFDIIVQSPDNHIFAASDDNNMIGYIQFFIVNDLGFEPFYEVSELLVSEKHRNRGIGKMLMEVVEEKAKAEGIQCVKLSSQVHRTGAHMFYENLGYEYFKISKFYEKKII